MKQYTQDQIHEVVKAFKDHEIIAIPTDTVYGVGVMYGDLDALHNLKHAKHRPETKPIPMMVSKLEQLEGIAIIDEIDLHLHPSLEQEVLARLKKTFPSIQFIVSTHSPMVLSNLKVKDTGNMIYRMQADEDTPNALPNLYGVDYSAAVYDFMGTPYADNEVKEEIEAILRLSRRGKPELVEKRKEELKSMVSEEQYINIISKINSQLAEDKY